MSLFIEYSLVGLASGGMYALIALGFVLVFKGTGVFNFAQGELMMVGAYVYLSATELMGWHWAIGLLSAVAVGFAMGALIERAVLRPLAGQPTLAIVMATVGIGLILKGIVGLAYGPDQRQLPELLPRKPIFIDDILIPGGIFWTFFVSIAIVVLCLMWFRFTRSGVAMRAAASSQVNAFAGVLLSSLNSLTPHLGDVALAVLAVLIVGGLDSLAGVIVGGLVIGWLQAVTGAYLGGSWREVMPYIVVLVVLLVRPHGLFGRKEIERI
jgi:branched-chain amino acid transport system permease protein